MPGMLSGPDPDGAATPYRQSTLRLNPPRWALTRRHWFLSRSADQIGRAGDARAGQTRNVELLPAFAWVLQPRLADKTYYIHDTEEVHWVIPERVVKHEFITHYKSWRNPDLPGAPAAEGIMPNGVPYFTKSIPSGHGWDEVLLEADEIAYPRPSQREDFPMDRVLSGKQTFAVNQGFVFSFLSPALPAVGFDNLHTFYFGGPSETLSTGEEITGGQWCVTFHGNGYATLFERSNGLWLRRFRFRYSTEGRTHAGEHAVFIQPYRNDRIIFSALQGEGDPQGASASQQGNAFPRRQTWNKSVYKHSDALTGHSFRYAICGAGSVRMDARRDHRFAVAIATLGYPALGFIYDLPFTIPSHVGGGTPIELHAETHLPAGTEIVGTLYDASTYEPLTEDANGAFLSVAGQSSYYAGFRLSSSADGDRTPELLGYSVEIDGYSELLAPTPTNLTPDSWDVEGPSLDPPEEQATVRIQDTTDAAALLRTRARIPCQIRTTINQAGDVSVLFDGEVARARERKTYLPGGRTKRAYDAQLVGMWARLWDRCVETLEQLGSDPNADPIDGVQPPYKVTDVVSYLLQKAGWPAVAIDVPDWDFRLWPTDNAKDVYVLQPGTRFGTLIIELLEKYLDAYLTWDPNAGTYGMWRVIPRPTTLGQNVLWHFVEGPATPGKPVHVPGAYAANTTFIRHNTLDTYPQSPEANYVLVRGLSKGGLPGDSGQYVLENWMFNPRSYQVPGCTVVPDPSHVDYLGEEVRLELNDVGLQEQAAVDFICRRVFDAVAYGRKWAEFEAPLVFVTDATDTHQVRPRPLRFGDQVTVAGEPGFISAVHMLAESDRAQMARYEVVLTASGGQF